MIEGIPARVSVVNSIILVNLPCFAYSVRYIAAPTPIGVATISVIRTR